MRLSSEVWAKFESKGKPEFNHTMHGALGIVMKEALKWAFHSYMGHYMKITLARTEAELNNATSHRGATLAERTAALAEFEAGLESLFKELEAEQS